MKRNGAVLLGSSILVGLFGIAAQARAQEAEAEPAGRTGFELGLRAGYAVPLGKVTGGKNSDDLNDTISGQIPLMVDLGYRATPAIMVGAYFGYGFGFIPSKVQDLCDTIDCSVRDLRLGAELKYHLSPGQDVDPWIGAGLGYEWLTISASDSGTDVSVTAKGWEFLGLQAGLDFPIAANAGLGPFVAFTFAQYDHVSSSCSGDCTGYNGDSEEITDKALHNWLILGVSATFLP